VLFGGVIVSLAFMSLPAWMVSRSRGNGSLWILFLSAPAIGVWVCLTALGIGAQSLSNLFEIFVIAILGVVLCYLKVFLLDKTVGRPHLTIVTVSLFLVAVAVLLRLFMPLLPE